MIFRGVCSINQVHTVAGDRESRFLFFFPVQGSIFTDEIVIRAVTAVLESASVLTCVQPGQISLILIINDAFASSVRLEFTVWNIVLCM